MKAVLRFDAELISKKNEWGRQTRRVRDGAGQFRIVRYVGLSEHAKSKVDFCTLELVRCWAVVQRARGKRFSVRHPRILWKFGLVNPAKDRDGVKTTLLDCLQAAGVLADDNVRECNGWDHCAPVEQAVGSDWVEIYLDWEESNEIEPRRAKARPGTSERRRGVRRAARR